MLRRLVLLILLVLAAAPSALAQSPASPPAAGSDAATSPSREDLQKLVRTLQNDQQREALVKQLQALLAAQQAEAAKASLTPSTLLDFARSRLEELGGELAETATDLVDVPTALAWFRSQVGDAAARERWLAIGHNVVLILGSAILADWILAAALSVPRRRLLGRRTTGGLSRAGSVATEILLDALPPLAFWATADLVIPIVQPHFATRSVVSDLVTVLLIGRVSLVVARAVLLVPARVSWRLLPLSEETASYLYVWIRRFVAWGVYMRGVVDTTWWLGVPGAVFATLQKSVALVVTLLAIVFVLQNRHAVAAWIRPREPAARSEPPPEDLGEMPVEPVAPAAPRHPALDILRHRLAEIWHVVAVVYLVGVFCVYALKIEGGFAFLFRASVLTLALAAAARFLVRVADRATRHGLAIPPDLSSRFPTLEIRANRYTPVLGSLAAVLIWGFALLAILEVWGIASFAWLGSDLGRRATGSALSIALILFATFAAWEILNASIDRYLAGIAADGGTIARSARVRTLLPLLRNTLWFTLLVITALLVLTELDVNIVPLLAGVSFVGLAVGFGSQALVKDVITGLFILIEDTIAVGDVVDLGAPHSGVVEAISIRTVRLRDQTGAIHTLPFSAITVIKNFGRDYAYWLIDLALPYSADPDRAIEVYRSVLAELKADPALDAVIVGDLEPLGVQAFNPASIQVQARIKTLPLKQWQVGREFNRRIKPALDEAGISLAPGAQTIGLDAGTAALLERLAAQRSGSSSEASAASSPQSSTRSAT
jgi:small conductance mechanosensitive channel